MTPIPDIKDVENRILHILQIYPKISPSMMQIGIGSQIPAAIWKPILEDLISNGLIKRDIIMGKSASGRIQTYTIISFKE